MEMRAEMKNPEPASSGDELRFSWTMDLGTDGVDAEPSNPFARAMDRLLKEGQPIKNISLCFLNLPVSQHDAAALRWLGVFVYSAGDRLLFFPGYADVPTKIVGFRGRSKMHDADKTTDHLSLERDKKSWHATSPDSKRHFGGPKPLDLGNGCVLWFGMSFPNRDAMRGVKKTTNVSSSVPSADTRRRTQVFEMARHNNAFPIVSVNTEHAYDPKPGFYHVSIIVGPPGFPLYTGCEHGYPRGSPFLIDPLPDALQVPISVYKLNMDTYCKLQITLMRLPGRIASSLALTSPSREQTTG
jgi:hypothetical protein